MHERTFHFIFGLLAQNLDDRFEYVLFVAQGPPGELLLSSAKQVAVFDGQVG
jgi:hypothetical protein